MPEFILGARGHDFGRHDPETLFSSIGQAGFACTQLAFTKAVEGVKSYADVTPALVERARAAAAASGVGIAVDGTYVELSYADEDKRRAEVAKVLSQIPVARALGAGCMGSETTNMAKQPGVTRKEAQEALLRSLGEILPACEEQGVLFAVECVYYHAMNTPEAVRMVLDTMASPNLRVICDFANYVGPEAASVDAQRRIWDKVGSWYGDKITAVHFKGQNFQPDGTLYSTSLEDSCVDYAALLPLPSAAPPAEAGRPISCVSLAILSFNSRRMRWASFFPTPGAAVSAFSSPVMIAIVRCSGVPTERMASAAFGPTPETPMSSLKLLSSCSVAKP